MEVAGERWSFEAADDGYSLWAFPEWTIRLGRWHVTLGLIWHGRSRGYYPTGGPWPILRQWTFGLVQVSHFLVDSAGAPLPRRGT